MTDAERMQRRKRLLDEIKATLREIAAGNRDTPGSLSPRERVLVQAAAMLPALVAADSGE